MTAREISKLLRKLADPERAVHSARYFKTGPGEYGAGDRFLGIRVPELRAQVRRCEGVSLAEIETLLMSEFHEERLFALLLLVRQFARGDEKKQAAIFRLYLNNTPRINNWDLVDSSASQIVGAHLASRDRKLLYKLARSASIWERRIAIIATFHFIRYDDFDDALRLAELLRDDEEDLIHKAVGWMLREIGKRNVAVEIGFLRTHYRSMPRTMLRYAIEKFPEQERKKYLRGEVGQGT
jgi:3-methyladenine DNA glycosylase AlkD